MSAIRGREHTHFPLKISTNCCLLIFPLLSLSLSDMSFLTSSFRGSNPRDRSATSKSPASICPAQCGFRRAQRQHHAHAHTHARTHKYAHKAPAREPSSASAGRECQQHNISPEPSVSRISKASSISFFCAPIAHRVSGSVRCLKARAQGPVASQQWRQNRRALGTPHRTKGDMRPFTHLPLGQRVPRRDLGLLGLLLLPGHRRHREPLLPAARSRTQIKIRGSFADKKTNNKNQSLWDPL